MTIRIEETAPNFTATTTMGTLNFHDWIGDQWCILFSHPKDFTPVCTTELGEAAKLKSEFEKLNCKIIGLSVDPIDDHHTWSKDIEETQGVKLNFPLIADDSRSTSTLYDMIHPEASSSFTVRSVFIIDPAKKVRLSMTYPASTGRNFEEILRVLQSLQLTDKHSVATPVNWKHGDDVIIVPTLTDEIQLQEKFPKGYTKIKPYLRITPQPDLP